MRVADGSILALKVVVAYTSQLEEEVEYMKTAHARVPLAVVAIEGDVVTGALSFGGMYGGYLMREVGSPVKHLSVRLHQIFRTLQNLHAAAIVHKDARIQNVVFVSAPESVAAKFYPKFIDFRACGFDAMCSVRSYRADVSCLVESIFKSQEIAVTAQEIDAMASLYDATTAGALAVADAVTRKWQIASIR